MTQLQMTTEITNDLSSYATLAYQASAIAGTAGPNNSPLATPAFTQAQAVNYLLASAINTANGPVALDAVTGKVSPGLINASGAQLFPSPFWSPTSYQSTPRSVTGTPIALFSVAIADPGYHYRLACFGLIDTTVSLDDGTFAQVLVRVGSTTGTIIAFGYGCAESYLGPAPGQPPAAGAFLNAPSTFAASWATIPSWTANPGSFMSGNFLQAPGALTGATLSSSVGFGAGVLGVAAKNATLATSLRIINQAGTVIGTGAAVADGSGTTTVSVTSNTTAGSLYTVQGQESGAKTEASIDSGTFTISPPQVVSSSMANIIPVPFEDQATIVGGTTLYMMLASSNNSTQVTASTFDPSLWVMPIPWAG